MKKSSSAPTQTSTTQTIGYYICCFLVCSFIGWIYEVTWAFAIGKGFVNKGFLYGCYLPIYGFGCLILHFLLGKLKQKKLCIGKINLTPVVMFVVIILIVSAIELFASYVLEWIFHKRWWNYKNDIITIDGRVSLRNSSLLATGGMIFMYLLKPVLDKTLGKLSKKAVNIAGGIIFTVIYTDLVVTLCGYFM